MYRAVAWKALSLGMDLKDPAALARLAGRLDIRFRPSRGEQRVFTDGIDLTKAIRLPEATRGASLVAVVPGVRRAMVHRQRSLGRRGGVVMEGRDIGTVVFPRADAKIFLHATPDERARRRHGDLRDDEVDASLEEVREQQQQRDLQDTSRTESPLQVARGSVVVDTTALTLDEVVERLIGEVAEILAE